MASAVLRASRGLIVLALCGVALLACASGASAATPAPAPQELGVACSSPFLELPATAGRCGPGERQVSLLPGPTSLCVVAGSDTVYPSSVTGGCARPFTSLTVPSATTNTYFCPGVLGLLVLVSSPRCPGGAPVYAVTKAPQAVNDVAGVSYGAPTATGNVLLNDLYTTVNPVTVTGLTSSGVVTQIATGFTATLADGSTLTISHSGAYGFTASAAFFASCSANATDVFGYTIANAYGQAASASLTVTLTCPPPESEAVNDSNSLTYNASGAETATGNLLANDVGLSSDPSAVTVVNGAVPVSGAISVAGTRGTLVVQTSGPNTGSYTYTPNGIPATCSTFTDTFIYTITDAYDRSSSALITIELDCNQPVPVATAQLADVSETTPTATGNLLSAVTVADGDTVSLASVAVAGMPVSVISTETVDLADGSKLTVEPDGAYSFTASAGFFTTCSADTYDAVDYTVGDEFGQTASSMLTISLACPPPEADLSIRDTDSAGGVFSAATNSTTGGTVVAGTTITYTIVVSNNGPGSADGATVSDLVPDGLADAVWEAVASDGASDTTDAGTGGIDDAVDLPSGSSITFTIDATVVASASGSLSNTATVTAPASVIDAMPSNNTATDTVTIRQDATLAITNSDGLTSPVPGQSLTYTIVVSNLGPSDATGVLVFDANGLYDIQSPGLPAGVTFNATTEVWAVAALAPGTTVTLRLQGIVPLNASGTLISTADATAADATGVSATDIDMIS